MLKEGKLKSEILSCKQCQIDLPFPPNPVFQFSALSKVLIIGQAPGKQVQLTGKPWNDKSGQLLKSWLGVEDDIFYNDSMIAHMPMGFCYTGKNKSGDLPPRSECAPLWHHKILSLMPNVQVIFLIGKYSQDYYLKDKSRLTDRVRNFDQYFHFIPLPHPSPRNFMWFKNNPWFYELVIPFVKSKINNVLFL